MKRLKAWLYFNWQLYRHDIKRFFTPSLILFFLLAYFMTNLWAYLFLVIGSATMRKIALSYVTVLWLPFTPEKIITVWLTYKFQKIWLWIKKPTFKSKIKYQGGFLCK